MRARTNTWSCWINTAIRDEAEAKIAKEMGWERELTEEEAEAGDGSESRKSIAACEEAVERAASPNPNRIAKALTGSAPKMATCGTRCSTAAHESAMKFWRQCDELGLEESEDT